MERNTDNSRTERHSEERDTQMRHVVKQTIYVVVAAVALLTTPQTARAEGFINPWAGIVFGNNETEKTFGSFGAAAGFIGRMVGLEANLGHAPNMFKETLKNSETDLTGNLFIGPMLGKGSYGVRPYVVGGLGIIRTSFEGFSSTQDPAFDLGAGVIVSFTPHLGVRGDARYFRTLNSDDPLGTAGDFHFWRAQLGVTLH